SPGSLPFTTAATELSAIHGHSTSQYRLGEFYLHGSDGKPLDYTQARYWYEQSAEQENPLLYIPGDSARTRFHLYEILSDEKL
ncbi:hypothetical protein ACUOFC_62895, partial [Escherichia sp. TWPC-MK]